MPKHKSNDLKIVAVRHYLQIQNQVETCKVFECSPRSLMRWVDRYRQGLELDRKNREPKAYKVTNEHVAFVIGLVKKNPEITAAEVLTAFNKKFPDVSISRVHIGRIMRDSNYTLKRTRVRHEPKTRFGKDVDIKDTLKKFYTEVKTHRPEDIICIDETSLNAFMVRKYCRGKIGKRCVVKTTSQEVFKKYTGVFAISSKGCVGYEVYRQGGIDSQRLIEFLQKHIITKYQGKLIILDNVSSHRNPEVKRAILENNNLLYAVPYQHFTNAIEMMFSVLKNKMSKDKSLTYEEISASVEKTLQNIPKSYFENLIRKTYFERKEIFTKRPSSRERPSKRYL